MEKRRRDREWRKREEKESGGRGKRQIEWRKREGPREDHLD